MVRLQLLDKLSLALCELLVLLLSLLNLDLHGLDLLSCFFAFRFLALNLLAQFGLHLGKLCRSFLSTMDFMILSVLERNLFMRNLKTNSQSDT